ncbi:MAG: DNA-3-methyladenine glycosylase I [Beijerinckiaceae bacterium]
MSLPEGLVLHPDGKLRCWWPGVDPLYVAYHDTDWGVPETDGRALFEKLVLDGFQAGLSWITILRKRENFRNAFDGFDAERIVRYDEAKRAALMLDAGIVRNRAKIEGIVPSARVFLEIEAKEGFARYLWKHVDGRPIQSNLKSRAEVPVATKISETISKDLKKRGFTFCGPTIVYAFMQACGLMNDHIIGCHRHAEVADIGRAVHVA